MKMTVSILVLVTSLVLAYGTQEPRDLHVTCKAPAVHAGDRGRVTCYFNTDVRQLPHPLSLSIEFYPQQKNTSELLAECNWQHKGDTGCRVKRPGDRFSVTDSGDMALEIAQVRADHVGRYVCQLMYSNRPDSSLEPCFLFVNESIVVRPPANSSRNEGGSTIYTHSEEQFQIVDPQVAATDSFSLTTVLLAVFGVLALVLVAVSAVFIRRRRMRGKSGVGIKQDVENGEETEQLRMRGKSGDGTEQQDVENGEEAEPLSTQGDTEDSAQTEGEKSPCRDDFSFSDEIQMRAAAANLGVKKMMSKELFPFGTKTSTEGIDC